MPKALLAACFAGLVAAAATASAAKYEPSWESLDKRPMPAWFDEARFGVFICWGPYSVPSWAPKGQYAEWYGNHMRKAGSPTANFHERAYGKDFKYEQFAPMMKGELFNPDEWAGLFQKSGAKYVVLAANYHDGFCLWPSPYAKGWNAVDTGPKRDVLGELSEAVRKRNLAMGIYYSLYEWYHPLWLTDRQRYVAEHFHPQFKDVITRYKPALVFADGEWEADDKLWRSEELLAWLFNESPVRDEIVVNDRWGKSRGKHGSFYESEYGGGNMGPAHPWQEDRGMGRSYGYNRNESVNEYDSADAMIRMLTRCAGGGGNYLLCIGPAADGAIPVIMQERLLQIGEWLKVNGDAIYGSKAGPFWPKRLPWGVCTYKPGRIFVILHGRQSGTVTLPGLTNKVAAASSTWAAIASACWRGKPGATAALFAAVPCGRRRHGCKQRSRGTRHRPTKLKYPAARPVYLQAQHTRISGSTGNRNAPCEGRLSASRWPCSRPSRSRPRCWRPSSWRPRATRPPPLSRTSRSQAPAGRRPGCSSPARPPRTSNSRGLSSRKTRAATPSAS